MKSRTPIFGVLILIALMLVKVSAFHIYSHGNFASDEIEDCAYCDLAIENQSAELFTDVFEDDLTVETIFFESRLSPIAHQNSFAGLKDNLELFLRPPPALG